MKGEAMTKLLYLEDFDVETCRANVQDVKEAEDGRTDVVLDATCFYPRGGGQDWDAGEIFAGDAVFLVGEVRLDETGTVHHIGVYKNGSFVKGDSAGCAVDTERRAINTRLHSGGHVIDMAVDSLGLDWVAIKGQHYPGLSAIEYSGTWQPEKAEELRAAIEQRTNELVRKSTENKLRFMPASEMHTVCRHVPASMPANKPARVVMYGENFGIPCGGTHVKNVSHVGVVKVPKLKEKKGAIRVSYEVEGIS